MKNLTGTWIGELNGTNQGRMTVNFQHDGDRIYGTGNINEPTLGIYQYQIQGVVKDEKVGLILTPGARSSSTIDLGNVEVNGRINNLGRLSGDWHSSIGTSGTFHIIKEELNDSKTQETKEEESNNSIFIVHGQDDATKEKVARFIEKLDLNAVILHEQVSCGMTIIEKFEAYSKKSGFAVALFTPDDIAYPLGQEENKNPRARQNVILEMGFFVGCLGRDRVCVLYKGDVELPSDILGVVYTEIDDTDSWKLSLAKELKVAGYEIDLNTLIS